MSQARPIPEALASKAILIVFDIRCEACKIPTPHVYRDDNLIECLKCRSEGRQTIIGRPTPKDR